MEDSMKTAKRILVWVILLIFTGMSAALAMKAAVGVSAWDAMSQSISMTTGIKIGTVAIGTNTLCVLLQLLLLRKNFRVRELLQIPLTIASGSVINFFYYDVFSAIAIKQYILNVLLLILAYLILAFFISGVTVINVVIFPLEGFVSALSKKTGQSFGKLRLLVDVVCAAISLGLTFLFSLQFTIREGTLLGMVMLGPLIGVFIKWLVPVIKRMGLLVESDRD